MFSFVGNCLFIILIMPFVLLLLLLSMGLIYLIVDCAKNIYEEFKR